MIKTVFDPHKKEGADLFFTEAMLAIERESFGDPWQEKSFLELMAMDAVTAALLFDDDSLIGYAFYATVLPEGELLNLAIKKQCRGLGLGRRLLTDSMSYLAEQGIKTFYLEVREGNMAARRLYGSVGFLPIGKRNRYYRNPTEDAIVMRFDEPDNKETI